MPAIRAPSPSSTGTTKRNPTTIAPSRSTEAKTATKNAKNTPIPAIIANAIVYATTATAPLPDGRRPSARSRAVKARAPARSSGIRSALASNGRIPVMRPPAVGVLHATDRRFPGGAGIR